MTQELIKKLQLQVDDLQGELDEATDLSQAEMDAIRKTLDATKAKLATAQSEYKAANKKTEPTPPKPAAKNEEPKPAAKKDEPKPAAKKEEPKPAEKKEEGEKAAKRISWMTPMSIEEISKYGEVRQSAAPASCQRRIVCQLSKDVECHIKGNATITARKGEYVEFVHIGEGKFRQFNVIANPTNCELGKMIKTTEAFLLSLAEDAEGRKQDSAENKAPFFIAQERLERLVPFINKLNEPMSVTVDDTMIGVKPGKGGAYDDSASVLNVAIITPEKTATFEVYNRLAEPLAYFADASDMKLLKSLLSDDSVVRKAAREWAKENKPSLLTERKKAAAPQPEPAKTEENKKEEPAAASKPAPAGAANEQPKGKKNCAVVAKEEKDKLFTYLASAASAYATGVTDSKVSKVFLTVDKKAVLEMKDKKGKPSYARLCPQTGNLTEVKAFNPDKDAVKEISTKSVEKLFTTKGQPNMADCSAIVEEFYNKCKDGECSRDEFKAFHEAAIGCKVAHNDKEHLAFLQNFTKEVLAVQYKQKLSFEAAWLKVLDLQ